MKLFVKRVAKTRVYDYLVSTVAKDGKYETAIKLLDRDYIVVQRYDNKDYAKIGHKKWVDFCGNKPLYALDVDTKEPTLF